MEITDLKVKNKNSIVVKDSLKAPLLKLSVSLDNSTTVPNSNDLIVYVGKNEISEMKEYNYTLSKPLKYLDNISDEFILSPKLNGERIDLKAYVIRRVGDSSVLDKEVIEEFFYEPIILDEGENYITTNYSNAILEIVYPKDTDIVNYFLSNSMYKESDNSLTMDDIYFKDAFTEADDGINADFNRVNLNCFKLKNSPFGLDALGNLTVNSLITVDNPTSGTDINFDMIYPVGSVYISVVNANPQTLFGGTWESFATGMTLVGVDTSKQEFNTVMKSGGEMEHTITINEMPQHSHSDNSSYSGENSRKLAKWEVTNTGEGFQLSTANVTKYVITDPLPEGGNQAHNNLQPYITVYMWRRVA